MQQQLVQQQQQQQQRAATVDAAAATAATYYNAADDSEPRINDGTATLPDANASYEYAAEGNAVCARPRKWDRPKFRCGLSCTIRNE